MLYYIMTSIIMMSLCYDIMSLYYGVLMSLHYDITLHYDGLVLNDDIKIL